MSAVGSEDDDGSEVALKCSVQVGEAFDIEHVDLVDEEHSWHQLSNTVIDVLVDNFVDLKSQLLGDFGLLRSVDLAHEREEVMSTLGSRIGDI